MKKRQIATKVSNSLSLGLFALAFLAAAAQQRDAQLRPEDRQAPAPRPAEAAADNSDRPAAVPNVVLPPPPMVPAAARTAEAPREQAAAPETKNARARPPRIIAPLKVEPKASTPRTTTEVAALKPRPKVQEPEAKPQASPAPAREEPRRDDPTADRDPVEVFERPRHEALAIVEPGEVALAEGRTVLRLLEHGSGPAVELAWPRRSADRVRLYERLRACFGMEVALLDRDNRMFISEGQPGSHWDINTDLYSGFIRRPSGSLSEEERREAARIRSHHRGLSQAHPVRVFPRQVDARLLGGLRQLVGEDYASMQSIRARYQLQGRRLFLEEIVADGQSFPGRVDLSRAAGKTCR